MFESEARQLDIREEGDVTRVRQAVREASTRLGFTIVDQTKIVTAASELARNALIYGGGGIVRIEAVSQGLKRGLRLVFSDEGPGIPNIEQALKDGYSTGTGMGLGLGGSRRLVNEFEIHSAPGEGTRVTVVKWK